MLILLTFVISCELIFIPVDPALLPADNTADKSEVVRVVHVGTVPSDVNTWPFVPIDSVVLVLLGPD